MIVFLIIVAIIGFAIYMSNREDTTSRDDSWDDHTATGSDTYQSEIDDLNYRLDNAANDKERKKLQRQLAEKERERRKAEREKHDLKCQLDNAPRWYATEGFCWTMGLLTLGVLVFVFFGSNYHSGVVTGYEGQISAKQTALNGALKKLGNAKSRVAEHEQTISTAKKQIKDHQATIAQYGTDKEQLTGQHQTDQSAIATLNRAIQEKSQKISPLKLLSNTRSSRPRLLSNKRRSFSLTLRQSTSNISMLRSSSKLSAFRTPIARRL